MTMRRWTTTALALIAFLVVTQPVAAYQFFYVSSGASRLPVAWRTLPVSVMVDMDPMGFRTTAQNAMNVWNAVTTATDMFGTPAISAVNFTGANFGTAWGVSGDGRFDIVCDADGSALVALGKDPTSVTGTAPTDRSVVGGQGAITDGFLIINCSLPEGATINYQATAVHELGHAIGLAHSSAFLDDAERLRPIAKNDAPTMYPFTLPTQTNKSTLQADDLAGISELYPGPTFATAYGTVSGVVTRCGTDDPVLGVNVRAVSTAQNLTQIARYTGFDGNTTGYYEMKVPPGTYNLIIEVMTLEQNRMVLFTRVDNDFATEYRSADAEEANCTEEVPDAATNIAVAAGDFGEGGQNDGPVVGAVTANQNFKTNPIELAFVVDDTGSMSNEISAVRAILTNQIARVRAETTRPFPTTAIVTFKDSVTIRKISRDPDQLQAIVNTLTASGGGDCPEWSNDALLAAGRMLRRGGKAMLFTDADSHPSRPPREPVAELYRSKSLRMDPVISGTCSGVGFDARDGASQMNPALSQNPGAPPGDEFPPEGTLGNQSSIETNSAIALATGGSFVAIPGIKTGSAVERDRYINTGTNIAVSATLPTISVLTPGDGPRGATIDVELRGSNTNFQASSVVAFAGTGITINTQSVRSATSILLSVTVAADAALGFRNVSVTTALGGGVTETATGVGAFNIVAAITTPTIVSVSPSIATRGSTLNVTIKGVATHFTGASIPLFCTSASCVAAGSHDAKIVVNTTTALDATTLVANITVAADATVSYRNVTVLTAAESARESAVGPFLIAPAALVLPSIVSITPSTGSQGQTLTVNVVGENTTWVDGTSALSFSGSGITVNNTIVTSPTTASANITIVPGTTAGFRDVFVTTGGETAALLNAFNVLGGPPTAMPATGFHVASIVGNVVTFRWTPPAAGLSPTDYVVEGGILPGQAAVTVGTGSTAPIFVVTAPSGAFYVRLHTISGASRSPASNEIRVYVNQPVVPSAPSNFLASVSGTSLSLGWRNTYAGGTPESMFLDVSGPLTASLALPGGETAAFTNVPGGTYTLSVRAFNSAGASTASNPVTVTIPSTCTGVPQAPSSFLAYRVGNVINVIWNAPNSGTAATSYNLIVTGAFNLTVPTTGRTLFGAVPPGTYNLSVSARNACGTSPATPVQTIVVP